MKVLQSAALLISACITLVSAVPIASEKSTISMEKREEPGYKPPPGAFESPKLGKRDTDKSDKGYKPPPGVLDH
ncbi:MAG: hypothetical protein M1831_004742 [Alyxoria varia]|nr:MAG: hypothetical protein M1831_004742 [Alyxoria varia]